MKFKFLTIISALFLITSCSKDDNGGGEGVYRITSMTISKPTDLNKDGITSTELLTELDCLKQNTVSLKKDGVLEVVLVLAGADEEGNYSCGDEDRGFFEGFKWSKNGNKIVVKYINEETGKEEQGDFAVVDGNKLIVNDFINIEVEVTTVVNGVTVTSRDVVSTSATFSK
jgi:hypothetical protein